MDLSSVLRKWCLVLMMFDVISVMTIDNNNQRDSYVSAYLDSKSTFEPSSSSFVKSDSDSYKQKSDIHSNTSPDNFYGPPGGGYAKPSFNHHPHQHALYHEYGVPHITHHDYNPPPNHPPEFSPLAFLTHLLSNLPHFDKYELIPKIASTVLEFVKILTKVLILKLIIKLLAIFCMFFLMPKFEMMMESENKMTQTTTTQAPDMAHKNRTLHSFGDNFELNKMTNFILDSIEEERSLSNNGIECNNWSNPSCRIKRAITTFDDYFSVPRLFRSFWTSENNPKGIKFE